MCLLGVTIRQCSYDMSCSQTVSLYCLMCIVTQFEQIKMMTMTMMNFRATIINEILEFYAEWTRIVIRLGI